MYFKPWQESITERMNLTDSYQVKKCIKDKDPSSLLELHLTTDLCAFCLCQKK